MTMKALNIKLLSKLANDEVKISFGHIDGMTSGSQFIIWMEQGGMRIAVQADRENFINFFGQAGRALRDL